MATEFDLLMSLWEEGRRRIAESEGAERALLERVADGIYAELRRRVGATFTTDELAAYYLKEGTDWCFEIAYTLAPGDPAAWDSGTVAAAAFARHARSASDWGGGVRREPLE